MERLHDGRLPQIRAAVDRPGAHAITTAACGIETADNPHTGTPSIMAKPWLSTGGKILLTM
jgi:hypothetical protein